MLKMNMTEKHAICTEAESLQTLKTELEKGVESMKKGNLVTIEEAWKEIDKI